MELELYNVSRADVTILHPTLNDIIALSRLPQGSLTAIWLEARSSDNRSMDAFFIGREAVAKAPYVLFRAPNQDPNHLRMLQREISDRFEVSSVEEISLGTDVASVTVHFKREKGAELLSSDKRLYQRAMRLITDPAAFGFKKVEPTRLLLSDLQIPSFAPLNRLGDAPYTKEINGTSARITIDRNATILSPGEHL